MENLTDQQKFSNFQKNLSYFQKLQINRKTFAFFN
jgi:hypothetical protein